MMRAREPDYVGTIELGGVRVGYDVYGAGEPTIVLLTSWAITHARQWKGQVPYLARHFRVITVEGRGNGRADRSATEEAYSDRNYVDDAIAAMDATGVDLAVVIGLSLAGRSASALSSASACGVGIWLIQDSAGRSSSNRPANGMCASDCTPRARSTFMPAVCSPA
jgi:pimeloyl-ACP methyl ester carboxylesterase